MVLTQTRLGMKELPKRIGVGLILLICSILSPLAHADTIYVSTFNLNTIDKYDSTGNGVTLATSAAGLRAYPKTPARR